MSRTFVIAEAGVNHNGSEELALRLVDAAADAGADAVKFQTFTADALASRTAPKAEYQQRLAEDPQESQWEMLHRLELAPEMHRALFARCEERGIEFMSSPFDPASVDLLVALGVKRLKLGSGEVTNGPLLVHAARTGKPIIVSTGMSTLREVEMALAALAFGYTQRDAEPSIPAFQEAFASEAGQAALRANVMLLHCTTEYPAPMEDVNLRAMDTLREQFKLPVGFSDHTPGIVVPIAATARGACVIEKHFTLDRNMPGPDHQASLEPQELREMVKAIRAVETCLGSGCKTAANSEKKNMAIARKSLVAAQSVRVGEQFSEKNLVVRRPGNGISPMRYWDVLGKAAVRDFAADELISE